MFPEFLFSPAERRILDRLKALAPPEALHERGPTPGGSTGTLNWNNLSPEDKKKVKQWIDGKLAAAGRFSQSLVDQNWTKATAEVVKRFYKEKGPILKQARSPEKPKGPQKVTYPGWGNSSGEERLAASLPATLFSGRRLWEEDGEDDSDASELKGWISKQNQRPQVFARIEKLYGDQWKVLLKEFVTYLRSLSSDDPFYLALTEVKGGMGKSDTSQRDQSQSYLDSHEADRARAFLKALVYHVIQEEIPPGGQHLEDPAAEDEDGFIKDAKESRGFRGVFLTLYLHLQEYFQAIANSRKKLSDPLSPTGAVIKVTTTPGFEAEVDAHGYVKKSSGENQVMAAKPEWIPAGVVAAIRTKQDYLDFLNPVSPIKRNLTAVQSGYYLTVKTTIAEGLGEKMLIHDFGLTPQDLRQGALIKHPFGKTNFPDFIIHVDKLTQETKNRLIKAFLRGWTSNRKLLEEAKYWLIDTKSTIKSLSTSPRMQYFRLKRIRKFLREKFIAFGGRPEIRDQLLRLFQFDDTLEKPFPLRKVISLYGPNSKEAFRTAQSKVKINVHEAQLFANLFMSGIAHEIPSKKELEKITPESMRDFRSQSRSMGSGLAKGAFTAEHLEAIREVINPQTRTLVIYQEVGAGAGTGAIYSMAVVSENDQEEIEVVHDLDRTDKKGDYTSFYFIRNTPNHGKRVFASLGFYNGSTLEYVKKYAPKAFISFKDQQFRLEIEDLKNEIAHLEHALALLKNKEYKKLFIRAPQPVTEAKKNKSPSQPKKPKKSAAEALLNQKTETKHWAAFFQAIKDLSSQESDVQQRAIAALSVGSAEEYEKVLNVLNQRLSTKQSSLKKKKKSHITTTLKGVYHYLLSRIPVPSNPETGKKGPLEEYINRFKARKKHPAFAGVTSIEICLGLPRGRKAKGANKEPLGDLKSYFGSGAPEDIPTDPGEYMAEGEEERYRYLAEAAEVFRRALERNQSDEINFLLQRLAVNSTDKVTWQKVVEDFAEARAELSHAKKISLDDVDVGIVDLDKRVYKDIAERLEKLESGGTLSEVLAKFKIRTNSDFAKSIPSDEWPLMWYWQDTTRALSMELRPKGVRIARTPEGGAFEDEPFHSLSSIRNPTGSTRYRFKGIVSPKTEGVRGRRGLRSQRALRLAQEALREAQRRQLRLRRKRQNIRERIRRKFRWKKYLI